MMSHAKYIFEHLLLLTSLCKVVLTIIKANMNVHYRETIVPLVAYRQLRKTACFNHDKGKTKKFLHNLRLIKILLLIRKKIIKKNMRSCL